MACCMTASSHYLTQCWHEINGSAISPKMCKICWQMSSLEIRFSKYFCIYPMQISYFWSRINIWYVNSARATAFIFDTRTDILVKMSKFLRQKSLGLGGTRNPKLRIHAEFSNHLSYQGQTFAVPCCWILALAYRYFLSKVSIWYVNCAQATAFIFDTRTDVLMKVSTFLRQKLSGPEGDSNPQPSYWCRML